MQCTQLRIIWNNMTFMLSLVDQRLALLTHLTENMRKCKRRKKNCVSLFFASRNRHVNEVYSTTHTSSSLRSLHAQLIPTAACCTPNSLNRNQTWTRWMSLLVCSSFSSYEIQFGVSREIVNHEIGIESWPRTFNRLIPNWTILNFNFSQKQLSQQCWNG